MSELDLSDPLVRKMAEYNHRPKEMWTISGQLLAVSCETCCREWPCPTRQALRAVEG